MSMKRTLSVVFALVSACLALASAARADSWALPEPQKYYSPNKAYYLEVFPRKLESQLKYFEDKTEGREPAGSAKGLKDNYCKGAFYKRDGRGVYEKIWEGRLVNDVAPVGALVSDRGEHFVTFDNWHALGYGDDVVVIYDRRGNVVRKMSLEDIYGKNPTVRLPRSVSSIYWGTGDHIEEETQTLVLKVVAKWSGSFEDEPETKFVRVDLKTGAVAGDRPVAE